MMATSRRPRIFHAGLVYLILTWVGPALGFYQQENPVYVDDSPLAWEMFQRAEDQTRDNAAESVRLYQELLDQYGDKVIPVAATETDRLFSVRTRVLAALRSAPQLLERYQRIEQAEAERLLAAGELEQLADTRSLTAPGLEALLRLGQRHLEAAHFRAALRLLSEAEAHPNIDADRLAHCHYMSGLASHYLGELARRDRAAEQLSALGRPGEAFRTELDRLIAQPAPMGAVSGIAALDRNVEFALEDIVPQEIWSKDLPETLAQRRFATTGGADRNRGFAPERRRRGTDVVTAAATVSEHAVYVNEGHAVRALDRFTGYEIWPAPFRDRLPVTIQDDPDSEVGDLNLIAIEGDALVTLTGHAGIDGRSSDGQIVCLDARSGDKRWAVSLDGLLGMEEYEGLYPYGAPLVAEGLVFCLARKQSTQTLTATYLIALELGSGKPKWVRHVASSALIRVQGTRPFSTPVYDRGEIIVATSVGAVACVDAASGEFKWLRVHRPPITEPALLRQPWEISGAALTPAGIVAIQPDERRVMLVDRTSGQMLESHPLGTADGWGAPRYLLADDRFVIAVGQDVRAFAIDNLERPLWQLPSVNQRSSVDGADASLDLPGDEFVLAGRVQLTSTAVIVPTADGLLLVDVETGREEQRNPLRSTAIPLAVDSQLFVTSPDSIDAYMPLGTAEKILRERLARTPEELEPALSLLRLGIRVRHLDLALEAAEKARRILASPDAALNISAEAGQESLFAMLLEAARLGLGDEVGTGGSQGTATSGATSGGERLHTMLRAVAITPEQQVEQLLAYGWWCEGHGLGPRAHGTGDDVAPHGARASATGPRLQTAVEAYQTILDHPLLAQTQRSEAGVSKTARQWAIDRLDQMIERHGGSVYAAQDDYARLELTRMTNSPGGPSIAALREISARFPFAAAAGEAAVRGAQLLAEGDQQREAMALLATVYRRVPSARQRSAPRLLGEMVRLSETLGWNNHAAALLRHAIDIHPDQVLVLADGSRDPRVWLEQLSAQEAGLPGVGAQHGPAEVFAGIPIGRQPGWLEVEATGERLLLLVSGAQLRALRAPDLAEAWTAEIGSGGASWDLVGVHDGQAILWQRSPIQDPRAVAIDLATGAKRWTTNSIAQAEQNAVEQIRRDRTGIELMPNGLPLNPAEVVPVLAGEKLLLVRRTGEVYAVDVRLGEPIVTLAAATLEEVHEVRATDLGIVLIGRSVPMGGRGAAGEKAPAILLLSKESGEALLRIEPRGTTGVLWSALTGLDELVFGTDAGVELVSLHTGERRWVQESSSALSTRRGWLAGEAVLVEDSSGALRSIDLGTGLLSEPFSRPRTAFGGDSSVLVDLLVNHGKIFAQFADRIVRVSNDGIVLGADAIADERDYRWLLAAADRLVLVSKAGTQQVRDPDRAESKTKHFYRIYVLSENGALMQDGSDLEPLDESIRNAELVDGWLILSTGSATLAVPMPPG